MATFREPRAPTSRKYVAEQDIVMRNWSKTFQTFWSDSSSFALEEQPKNLNFQSVFTSNRRFDGYFQRNACTYFQKICSWSRYSNAKLIKNISNFSVALLRFCIRKVTWKMINFWMQLPLKETLVATFNKACTLTSRK